MSTASILGTPAYQFNQIPLSGTLSNSVLFTCPASSIVFLTMSYAHIASGIYTYSVQTQNPATLAFVNVVAWQAGGTSGSSPWPYLVQSPTPAGIVDNGEAVTVTVGGNILTAQKTRLNYELGAVIMYPGDRFVVNGSGSGNGLSYFTYTITAN
jgi:hypothetical protein